MMPTPTAPHSALLAVEHLTRYRYTQPVELAHHLAYLQPLDGGVQDVESHELTITPTPHFRSGGRDRLGNERCVFTVDVAHAALQVRSRCRVRVHAPPPIDAAATAPWESVRERLVYVAGRRFEPACEFVPHSPYVPALPALHDWAAADFTPGRPVAEVGIALMARLHAEFTYRSASTEIDTPLAEVLARKEGVCQDFAHLLLGALRSRGLAARYVSGYLLTSSPEGGASGAPWLGADASHAWVALWCPVADGSTAHWLELDPTNDVLPSIGHLRLAIGRDYGDVTPLRGVIRGGGDHRLEVRVRTARVDDPA
jgi:transglutaminase-like putative cysteine protease